MLKTINIAVQDMVGSYLYIQTGRPVGLNVLAKKSMEIWRMSSMKFTIIRS